VHYIRRSVIKLASAVADALSATPASKTWTPYAERERSHETWMNADEVTLIGIRSCAPGWIMQGIL
jgi:hypothetical protein